MVKKLVYAGMLCSALLWWGCSRTEPDKAITVEVDLNAGNDTDSIEDIFAVERLIPLQAGGMIGGTVLIEKIFNWPGLGNYALMSIKAFDLYVVAGIALIMSIVYVLISLIVDVLYVVIDPRVRLT